MAAVQNLYSTTGPESNTGHNGGRRALITNLINLKELKSDLKW